MAVKYYDLSEEPGLMSADEMTAMFKLLEDNTYMIWIDEDRKLHFKVVEKKEDECKSSS